jgi:hypothetical protein
MRMADFISKEKVVTTDIEQAREQGYFEKRLSLYVANPDTFWRVINSKADQMAMRYGMTPSNFRYNLPKVSAQHVEAYASAFANAMQTGTPNPVKVGIEALFELLRKEL